VKNQRGVVYLEMLIGFLPVFMFFLGTLQVADLSVAHLVVEHAATTAARAAVVVLPDDGAYYEDEDNGAVNEFRDYRQSDVERAADTLLAANPRLDLGATNVALEKPTYEERELLKAQVTAPYRCLVPIFCPGGLTISADAQLVYQGAHYIYEPSTGWASSAANRGLDNIRNRVSDYRERRRRDGDQGNPRPGDDDTTRPDDGDDTTRPDDGDDTTRPRDGDDTTRPRDGDDTTRPDDGDDTTRPRDGDDTTRPRDGDDTTRPRDGDDTTRPRDGDDQANPRPRPDLDDDPSNDAANQRRVDDLRQALPRRLRDVPIQIDPNLPGSTVQVHYTHDDRGRITGIEVHAGPDAQPRHIQDHVPTIRAMQRYTGVAGRARALVDRFRGWLTGNPNAGPGTLAWETHREVEKLTGIIENRAKQLEDPNLTPAQRRELERELDSYEKQLAHHEKVLEDVTNEPGRGYVAANQYGRTGREEAQHRYGDDVPDPPNGYHWSLAPDGSPIVVRDRKKGDDGTTRPPREFNPDATPDPSDPLAQWPERTVTGARYRTDPDAISGEQPVTADVRKRAAERQKVANAKATDKTTMDKLAKQAKITADLTKKDGADIIKAERDKAAAKGDQARVALLDKLAAAQSSYKKNELELQRQSEQLGNEMAEAYMAAQHPDHTQKYPPPGTPYSPGKQAEFDYVYTQGEPPTSIIIVEAKGAGSSLGTGAGGTESQGTPGYMKHVAAQMYQKEADKNSPAAKMWKAIAEGGTDPDGPEVRYIKVQAPVTKNGDPRPGQIGEFDLSTPPPDESATDEGTTDESNP
jgi:hypothetical protein